MSRTQRELKALRQQQREEAAARQRARDRRNLLIVVGVLALVALAITGVALYLNHSAQVQAERRLPYQAVSGDVGTPVPDEGRNHIDPSQTWTYKSYPPASGPHYNQSGFAPLQWGTIAPQNQPLLEGQYIHNLEHGGIVILYDCPSGSSCTNLANQLTDYVNNLAPLDPEFHKAKVIMSPYTQGMQKKVAVVAWDYIEFLDGYDQNAITRFYNKHVDQAPEHVA